VVLESRLESTEHGLVPMGEGWFVLNARDARWYHTDGRSAVCVFEGEEGENEFEQLGINISVLEPGEIMAMYHWEADQEDFLVLSGDAVLVIEGEERPLKQWDFVHCPPETKHTIVGAGDGPAIVLAVGAREKTAGGGPGWGGYSVDETAARHGASVQEDTTEPKEAYAYLTRRRHATYREGWLP
jgi:quercetin dioxygenase-like cupin family protein